MGGAARDPDDDPGADGASRPLRAGDWLDGPGGASTVDQPWPGHRLGLPRAGQGSVATFGRRLLQLAVDLALSLLVGSVVFLLGVENTAMSRNLAGTAALVLQMTVLTALSGQSMGMALTGLRVRRVDGSGPLAPVAALSARAAAGARRPRAGAGRRPARAARPCRGRGRRARLNGRRPAGCG